MTDRERIIDQIRINLETAGWSREGQEIRLQPDPYEGWRLVVISEGFAETSRSQRKKTVLADLNDFHFEWVDLITPSEKETSDSLSIDLDPDEDPYPFWAEMLAKQQREQLVFPSDLDEDLAPPITATFYSLRGGVGRSTALCYTARILASKGRKVVCVDMDLEAPGLAALFGKEAELERDQGLVYILSTLDRGDDVDISQHLVPIADDSLFLLPAGIPDALYARTLSMLNPTFWYREERNVIRDFFNKLKTELPFQPDVILIDARTGITPMSGPLLFDLADMAIITMFPHPQARKGTGELVRGLLASSTVREKHLTPEPRFLISPIPASKAPEVISRYQNRTLDWIAEWLTPMSNREESVEELTHFVPYRETIATSDAIQTDRDSWDDYAQIAEWIERFLTSNSEIIEEVDDHEKSALLNALSFSTGTAENQEHFLENFVETELVSKALVPQVPLVLGRKGTGKTAVFRRLVELNPKTNLAVLAPIRLRDNMPWQLGADGFKRIHRQLPELNSNWRVFWMAYLCIACRYGGIAEIAEVKAVDQIEACLPSELVSELVVTELITGLLKLEDAGLLLNDWLTRIDSAAPPNYLLLFDGLDTGFGHESQGRTVRTEAISGLFAFFTDLADGFKNLRLKIMLREDIWRKLKFENKSHLYGRTARLEWHNRADFFKVVLIQALKAKPFEAWIRRAGWAQLCEKPLGSWTDEEVYRIWNILIGERMKGGRTAFTRNWVWKRLADANGDHSPRYLLALFNMATAWEKTEHQKNAYERSIIRPRALMAVLKEVSEQAYRALIDEEFQELETLMDRLKHVGITPFPASDLSNVDLTSLAQEVGVMGTYEKSGEQIVRFFIPEIYRLALGLKRRGQA